MASPVRVGQRLAINERLIVRVIAVRDDGNTIDVDYETEQIRMTRAEYEALSERARANIADVLVIVEED